MPRKPDSGTPIWMQCTNKSPKVRRQGATRFIVPILLLVFLGETLFVGLAARPPATSVIRSSQMGKRARTIYYRVRRGDTLTHIARRYRTTVATLRRWNRLGPKAVLLAGKRIRVPAPRRTRRISRRARHKVARRKVARKKTTRSRKYYERSSWTRLDSGTRVLLPYDYKKPKVRTRNWKRGPYAVSMTARRFARGEAALVEVRKSTPAGTPKKLRLRFQGRTVALNPSKDSYWAIVALSPHRKKRVERLELQADQEKMEIAVPVAPTRFPVVVWKRYLGNYDKPRRKPTAEQRAAYAKKRRERRALLRKSYKKKKIAFAIRSPEQFSSAVAHPRGHHKVTSPFFTRRKITRYYIKKRRKRWKKPFYRRHNGLDLHGKTGAPIYAMADGTVVAAQRMYYEGNFTVIDHGRGVFTGYMHQSEMQVKEGDRVKAGQLIGKVGTTGRVTGPHLHVGLYIRGTPVHPLSLLSLPVR